MEIIETPFSRLLRFVADAIRRIPGKPARDISIDPATAARPGWIPPAIPNVPPPDVGRFLGVVPVAQTQTVGETAVTLIAIELYAEGMRLTGLVENEARLHRERRIPPRELTHFHVVGAASDDTGTQYLCWPDMFDRDGHFTLVLGPARDPAAMEMTIIFPELRWETFEPRRRAASSVTEPGPWTYTVRWPPREL